MTTTLADRNLEEQIFQLQKLELDSSVRQIVDEAAQLLAEGRHLEAGALLEKAEAMRASGETAPSLPEPAGAPSSAAHAAARLARELAAGLADGIATVLAQSIQSLEAHLVSESRQSSQAFSDRLQRLQETVESLLPLKEQIEHLAGTISEQHAAGMALEQKHEQLSAATASLQEASGRHGAEIAGLRGAAQELAASVSGRLDTAFTRLDVHQQQLEALNSAVSDLPPRIAHLIERLDRQAGVIRSLCEGQAQRESALDQVVEALTRLRQSRTATAAPQDGL